MFVDESKVLSYKSTTYKVVLPFYAYAAVSFLIATLLLFISASAFTQHYFNPKILAITHIMALGWGTMLILGTSHQLLPVLIDGRLYSIRLAYSSFILAAIGIPILVYGFYSYNMTWPAKWGGRLIFLSILMYLINVAKSMIGSQHRNVHSIFMLTAAIWLFITTSFGLILVYNYSYPVLSHKSFEYLPLHAHTGIIGWFLLLIMGVGSRLIPMFLISKYRNPKLLWIVYGLVNGGLLFFVVPFLCSYGIYFYLIPTAIIFGAILLFGTYCRNCYIQRIRKQVDDQVKFSLLSVAMMIVPVMLLILIIIFLLISSLDVQLVLIYGFVVFFGWITSIILGMTFKTLPFIVWNKIYHLKLGLGKTPNPKDLFSHKIYGIMGIMYLAGFILFVVGVYSKVIFILNMAAVLLLFAAVLYNWNVIKVLMHKPVRG